MSTGSLILWMFGLPAAVLAAVVGVTAAVQRRRDRLIATTGRRAIGRVLAAGSDTYDLGGSTYWVRVQFDYDGEPVTARVVVSERDQRQYRVSQRIALTYAPSRPQVVKLDPP
ncbi:hypothetical protein GCM10023196_062910 [Actinoallomurus vinaceus]|uniref:DUF3592 domain-containing protein n=1 Tax=Actinoallomurus vinaceus TaxID=1080074 RepID=A0ABP8UH06_9ACTN